MFGTSRTAGALGAIVLSEEPEESSEWAEPGLRPEDPAPIQSLRITGYRRTKMAAVPLSCAICHMYSQPALSSSGAWLPVRPEAARRVL